MLNLVKILVIEDNNDHISIINVINKEFDFVIDIARNTKEFLESISKIDYNLILCDINLDYNGEGMEILKLYRNRNKKGRIYAYTTDIRNKNFFIEQGFDGVIKKNILELRSLLVTLTNNYDVKANSPLLEEKI